MYRPQSVPRAWSGPTNTWNTVGHSSRHVNIVNSDDDEDASDIEQNECVVIGCTGLYSHLCIALVKDNLQGLHHL